MIIREIVLDTETTGLSARDGDRIVEIGALELINRLPSGRIYHQYINPQRNMPDAAYAVHGLSSEFLADKPLFPAIADAFLEFLGEADLVIHNSAFDIAFINAELKGAGRGPLKKNKIVDTLDMARRKFPGGSNSLDGLCNRFAIDNKHRKLHGALLDCELLAEVYLELTGGRQAGLDLEDRSEDGASSTAERATAIQRPSPLPPRLSQAMQEKHAGFIKELPGEPVWKRYTD